MFAAIKGYALSYLSSSAGRIRFLLGTPGMVALDIDSTLKALFQHIVHCLENIPKPQGETVSSITCDLSVRMLIIFIFIPHSSFLVTRGFRMPTHRILVVKKM